MKKSIRTEIIINSSRKNVWNILTDFKNYPNWNSFIVSIEGSLEKGGRLKNVLKNGHKTMVFKPVILDVDPGKSFSWLGSLFVKGLFDGRHYFEIEEIGPEQVRLIHGEEFSGILSTAILKKIGDDTRKNFVNMNQAIKNMAEKTGVPVM